MSEHLLAFNVQIMADFAEARKGLKGRRRSIEEIPI